ncbi:MAG: ComF family protein [Actinomycetota bacterium]
MDGEQAEIPIIAVGRYEGELRQLVTQWKFRRRTLLTRRLANIIVDELADRVKSANVDVVTWAPTSDRRRRTRGYDQAELLATSVARQLRVPSRRLLRRNGEGAQTGRNRLERLVDGPSFRVRPVREPMRILVVDDVVTTGSTLRSAGKALLAAGHREVTLVALGSTPLAVVGSRVDPEIQPSRKERDSADFGARCSCERPSGF